LVLEPLAEGLGAASARLSAADAAAAARALTDAVAKETSPLALRYLAEGLGAVSVPHEQGEPK
jgi:hypothetical protein